MLQINIKGNSLKDIDKQIHQCRSALVAAATLGDLIESLIKRDVGIKDMSSFLPGHGGIMDRLDSLLVAAPVAWLVLYYLVPSA